MLAQKAPTIWRDLARDRKATALHAAWGQSHNFDEHEKKAIVAPAVLDALGARLGVPSRLDTGPEAHAGLQHTVGYLFSTLWTAYGYKRARWVDGELERGLHLAAGLLGPTPPEGTLYANVTCALARVAFAAPAWKAIAASCVPAIARMPRTKHPVLIERIGEVALRTEWIPLGAARYLLVYSSETKGVRRLLTSFPVDTKVVDGLRAQPMGPTTIEARYNAFVPGLESPQRGERTLLAPGLDPGPE